MRGEPLFSVIIPTRDRPDLLQLAVASVLAQTVRDFECVVVDDGTVDGMPLPVEDRIRVVPTGGGGGAAVARNVGLGAARGRLIAFLDDDDEFTSDRLAIGLQGLRAAPIALCWRSRIGARDRADWRRRLEGDADQVLAGPVPHLGQTLLARDMAPLFDPRFEVTEDVEWWVRASAAATVTTVPRVGYLMRNHVRDRQTARLQARLEARELLLETHADFFAERPHVAAYHWKRLGGIAKRAGERQLARTAFARSLRLVPRVSTALRLVTS